MDFYQKSAILRKIFIYTIMFFAKLNKVATLGAAATEKEKSAGNMSNGELLAALDIDEPSSESCTKDNVGNTCMANTIWSGTPSVKVNGSVVKMDIPELFFLNSEMEYEAVDEKDRSHEVYTISAN